MIRQIAQTFLFIILYSSTIYSQGWFWQNPLPQGNDLMDIFIIDATTAVAIGRVGTIIKTSDEGTTWEFQTSGTNYNLNSVYFTDSNIGWIVGDGGTILKTTDGGTHWNTEISGTIKILESVYFSRPDCAAAKISCFAIANFVSFIRLRF